MGNVNFRNRYEYPSMQKCRICDPNIQRVWYFIEC